MGRPDIHITADAATAVDSKYSDADVEELVFTGPPFDLNLSILDQAATDVIIKRSAAFVLPSGQPDAAEHAISVLRSTTARLVHRIPWLAATVTPNPRNALGRSLYRLWLSFFAALLPATWTAALLARPWAARARDYLWTRVGRWGEPVTVVARGELHLRIRRHCPGVHADSLVSGEVPASFFADAPRKAPASGFHACGIQLNVVEGHGIVVAMTFHHGLVDGHGVSLVFKQFAEECRAVQAGLATPEGPLPNIFYRELQANTAAAATGAGASHSRRVTLKPFGTFGDLGRLIVAVVKFAYKEKTLRPSFLVSADKAAELRALVAAAAARDSGTGAARENMPPVAKLTVHDLVAALIFRSFLRARHARGRFDRTATATFNMVADIRRSLVPAAPGAPYFGNGVTVVDADVPYDELDDAAEPARGVWLGASAIRTSILSLDARAVGAILATYARAADPRITLPRTFVSVVDGPAIVLSSRYKYVFSQYDWGPALGSYLSMCHPREKEMDGLVQVHPAEPDGGMLFTLSIDAGALAALRQDEFWRQFTSEV